MSANDFTNEYKKKVDALQTLYRFKGNVETLTELNSKTDNNIGDTWNCEEDGNNYCWNKTEWVNIGTDIDLSAYALQADLEIKVDKTELEEAIQEVSDTIVNTPATQEQAGLMSPEDKTKLDNYVGGITGDTLPIGSIVEWASDTVPANWLLCNGQAVSRTDYAELFNTIGTIYGTGDGSTTFNLPNFKGRVAVGKDDNDTDFNTLGKTGGEKEHVLTIEEMPEHNHPAPSGYDTSNWYLMYGEAYSKPGTYAGGTYPYVTPNKNAHSQGGSQPHNNLQPFVVTNFIIKAHQSAGVVAEVIQKDGEASSTNVYSAEATKQAIENTKSWKFYKEVTGSQQINIANLEFTELLIVAKFNNTDGNYVLGSSLVLPKEILTETLEYYDMGSTVCIIRIGASKTSIVLNMSTAYNTNFASTTNIKVFYK